MTKYVSERVVYGLLDYMGDVGGFVDALRIIATVFISLTTFQPLSQFLIKKLYKASHLNEQANSSLQSS